MLAINTNYKIFKILYKLRGKLGMYIFSLFYDKIWPTLIVSISNICISMIGL